VLSWRIKGGPVLSHGAQPKAWFDAWPLIIITLLALYAGYFAPPTTGSSGSPSTTRKCSKGLPSI